MSFGSPHRCAKSQIGTLNQDYAILPVFEGARLSQRRTFCLPDKSASMVNYYDILKVSSKASGTEIKSAYRRLARKLHPDRNNGSEATALKFAAIAEAYEVLGNSKERVKYDRRLIDVQFAGNGNGDSVFASGNTHAKRWRQMVYEKRYNDIIDRMIAEERRESLALQRFIFPLVALFVSTLAAAILRPNVFLSAMLSDWTGMLIRIVVVSLFVVGVIHFVGRVRDAFDRYAYDDNNLHDSVLDETELPTKNYSRYSMCALIIAGTVLCVAAGLTVGYGLGLRSTSMPYLFSAAPQLDILLYPPIFVLIVDAIHGLILTAEG